MSGRITTPAPGLVAGSAYAAEKRGPSAALRGGDPRPATSPLRGRAGRRRAGGGGGGGSRRRRRGWEGRARPPRPAGGGGAAGCGGGRAGAVSTAPPPAAPAGVSHPDRRSVAGGLARGFRPAAED